VEDDDIFILRSGIYISISVFYFTNWAEYFTGILNTAKNGFGVIEVQYIIIFKHILTGIYGQ